MNGATTSGDWPLASYRLRDTGDLLTPALALFPDAIDLNIAATVRLLGGEADRWRPHMKTSKLAYVLRRLLAAGVRNLKCSTTLELRTAAELGAADVLMAYPAMGANARRVAELARKFPQTKVAVLAESAEQLESWRGSPVGIFIDLNPGMHRTGLDPSRTADVVALARRVAEGGQVLRGLHQYEGHLAELDAQERERQAYRGYDRLLATVAALEAAGLPVAEVVTSGTPAFPCAVSYRGFRAARFVHRVSPGTVVYNDATSLRQLPHDAGYRPAALVLSRVVSRPGAHRITCDAGHKAVSADAGVPTCTVVGYPHLEPGKPSEEHLPIEVREGLAAPALGEILYLLPRHVCPTVNNFDHALIVRDGRVQAMERVTARGHEAPWWGAEQA